MAVPIDHALKVLDYEFEEVVKLFETDDWKFFKFGVGGPYKRHLTKLTEMSKEMDSVIFDRFGVHEDNASFTSLIVLCLDNAKGDYQKEYKGVDTFRRQLKRMRGQL